MTSNINSFINTLLGFISSPRPANGEQPNLPAPQPIAGAETSLIGSAIEVASDALQTVRNCVIKNNQKIKGK